MNTELCDIPAAACGWCGRENSDRLPRCSGCGTRLVAEPAPTESEKAGGRSRILAVMLALVFGPLGLIYVRAWGTLLAMMAITIPLVLTSTGGLWVTIGIRIVSAAIAYALAVEQDERPDVRRDSTRLLDEAARMESVDRPKAVMMYEEIVRLYPDTPASREAARAIRTLTTAA